jgi:hypothetical protein
MLQTRGVATTIGADDVGLFASPQRDLLRAISGIDPVEKGTHVLLEPHGVRSSHRLAAGDVGGALWVALWPAELKEQATYLYGQRLAGPMIEASRAHGWTAQPSPHLAFRNSQPALRLYMSPPLDASEYARRWEDGDLERVGAHSRAEVRQTLWPWLKSRGYATDADDEVVEDWLSRCLGNRDALLRPGLRLKRECGSATSPETLRREVDAILAAAGEPLLPASRA